MASLPNYSSISPDPNDEESILESQHTPPRRPRAPSAEQNRRKSIHVSKRRSQAIVENGSSIHSQEEVQSEVEGPLDPKKHPFTEMFGFMPFSRLNAFKNDRNVFGSVKKASAKASKKSSDSLVNFKNIMWVLLVGWIMSLVYAILAVVMAVTYFGIPHAWVCWQLAGYFIWPFGKYLVRLDRPTQMAMLHYTSTPSDATDASPLQGFQPQPRSTFKFVVGHILWLILAVPILLILHSLMFILNWMPIITIPMAKVNREMLKLLFRSPRSIRVVNQYPGPGAQLLLGTFESSSLKYFRYSVAGVSVVLINLIPFIVATIVLGKVPVAWRPPPIFLFFTSLLSIIPTAYFIGLAVSSISAQSNFAVGAILNATFGSIVEIILYTVAIYSGELDNLVISSVTGALLATLLLIPGLSMIAGGLKHKEQYYNVSAAGVSNILLIFSVIGLFTPTVFYASFRDTPMQCSQCDPLSNGKLTCHTCKLYGITTDDIENDPVYKDGARLLVYAISFVLPLAYIIGLIFTLKTHSYLYDKPTHPEGEEAPQDHGEEAPEWPKWVALLILLTGTASFALVSDELVTNITTSLDALGLSQQFVGVFFVGLASSSAEIVNAVNFALSNNIALSIEIGAAGTIQAALIQIPALVLISLVMKSPFVLIFPMMNVFAVGVSVIVNNYLSINGKSNYFEGAAMVLVYILFILAFFFIIPPHKAT